MILKSISQFRATPSRVILVLLAASSLALAQDPSQSGTQPSTAPNGGWRRAADSPPVPVAAAQEPTPPASGSDAYGQPPQAAPPAARPPQSQPPANRRPAYGLPAELTLRPGTFVTVRTNQPLSSDRNQPGDPFSVTLEQPVVVDGVVIAQRGQTMYGRVAETEKAHGGKPSRLGLELTSMTLADGTQVPVRTQLVARQGTTTPAGVQAGTVATTTAVGASIGAAADWGTGAAVGAGAGAAAGIIGVLLTRNHPTVLYPETPLTFRVETPVTVSTTRAPQAFRYVGPEEYNRPVQARIQPRPGPPAYYGYGYGPGYYPYYPYYPYYWGPGVSVYWGPGFFYGRGWYRRWR